MMLTSALVHCILLITFISGQKDAGSPCNLSTGQEGECVVIDKCWHARDDLKNKRIPQTCSFQGTTPIICCLKNISLISTSPSTEVTTETITSTSSRTESRTVGAISKQKCREYSKHAFINRVPVLIADVDSYMKNVCDFRINLENDTRGIARTNEFPHMALVGYVVEDDEISWRCGGSLISEQYVLTVAHCFYTSIYGEAKYVKVGITNRIKDTRHLQQRRIIQKIEHPNYKSSKFYDDIGLLKLEKPIEITPYAGLACLYTEHNIVANRAVATGWGATTFGSGFDDELHKVVMKFISPKECNKTYRNAGKRLRQGIIDASMLCAESTSYADACQGDSGGPLQIYHSGDDVECMYDIVGLVSFGKACGIANVAGVFTRVSNYIKWIEDVVWP